MQVPSLQILSSDLLASYCEEVSPELENAFNALQDAELSNEHFSFYTSVASVFSSKIEGEEIELDSYIKHKRFGVPFQPDYTRKTDDLYAAYSFAKTASLNEEGVVQAHQLLSKHLVSVSRQGRLRTENMYVSTPDGRIEYVAASPFEVKEEMRKFYADVQALLQTSLSIEESFYYASMIHLVFVKIHPWSDGNGRTARLLEKWFLAEKMGEKAWFIPSERYYYEQHSLYYKNIRQLGIEYDELDYSKALPFLLMLPTSITGGRREG